MSELDVELQAIQAVIDALEPLESEARDRVIHYAFDRLGLNYAEGGEPGKRPEPSVADRRGDDGPGSGEQPGPRNVVDIRTLREEKQPGSANEMAAVVGYYLAELAPPSDRRSEIGTDDIQRLFKQGSYPLPKRPSMTLPNASAAGYFESLGGGKYKLNPVGHNLVAHSLPRKQKTATRTRSTSASRSSSKKQASGRTARSKSTQTASKKSRKGS